MKLIELKELIDNFECFGEEENKTYLKELEKRRKTFVKTFNIEKIKALTIDEYIIGKESKESFCYQLETKLRDLGNIKGSNAKKFGLYYGTYGNTNKKYQFYKRWSNKEEALEKIKLNIISLIINGKTKNIEVLKNNTISTMFKGKILSTYYPKKYLSVYSNDDLNYFLKIFNLYNENINKLDPIEKRELILNFKESNEIMRNWDLNKFQSFLYSKEITPKVKKIKNKKDKNVTNIDYTNFKAEFIEFELSNIQKKENISKRTNKVTKIDFIQKNKNNFKQGSYGEEIVKDLEINYLKNNNRKDLIKLVKRVSEDSDSLGYDILSFELDGTPKYIEVKTTQTSPKNTHFYISDNELQKSKEISNYYIYIVFLSKNSKVFKWKDPFNNKNKYNLIPINYKVELNLINL